MKSFGYLCNVEVEEIMEKDLKKEKESLLKAIKKAKKHKEQARKRTAEEWKREGIKGNVVLV